MYIYKNNKDISIMKKNYISIHQPKIEMYNTFPLNAMLKNIPLFKWPNMVELEVVATKYFLSIVEPTCGNLILSYFAFPFLYIEHLDLIWYNVTVNLLFYGWKLNKLYSNINKKILKIFLWFKFFRTTTLKIKHTKSKVNLIKSSLIQSFIR